MAAGLVALTRADWVDDDNSVDTFDCINNVGPVQVLIFGDDDFYSVRELDEDTGERAPASGGKTGLRGRFRRVAAACRGFPPGRGARPGDMSRPREWGAKSLERKSAVTTRAPRPAALPPSARAFFEGSAVAL